MNGALCPDIQAFLNVMNAVILAFLAGSMIFKASCATGHGVWVLPVITALMWGAGLYAMFSKSLLSTAALFIVALTPFKLVTRCPSDTADIHANAAGEMGVIKANVLAILFVSSVQYLLALDRPSMIAVDTLDKAFKDVRKAYDAFWSGEDASAAMSAVAGDIDAGSGYNASARIEPRFFRYPWKGDFYSELTDLLKQVRLDILMLYSGMTGSGGKLTILQTICTVPEFASVRDDLNQTLGDAHMLAIGLLSSEGATYDGLKFLKDVESIDRLDALPKLISRLSASPSIGFPMSLAESLENDQLCQLSAVFLMLERTVAHVADIIKCTVQYS